MATRKLLIMAPLMLFIICWMVEAAPRPPPLQHHSSIPGASENEIEENVNEIHDDDKVDKEMDDLGLEYGRYLQEIVKALDDDPVFSKKLENVTHEQIMNGHVARIIDQVAPDVRSRLDELKRIELERLRQLTMKEHKLEEEIEEEQKRRDGAYKNNDDDLESGRRWRTTISKKRPSRVPTPLLDDGNAPHIDHRNPHTFEAEDLQKLILQATKDLDELDKKRRRDFKQYEMEKELHQRESMQNMTAEQKLEAEKKQEEIKRKHQEHPKVHHPGSRQQFEQVWEEQDHMPKQEFNPKLFFQMHDINGDGFLDQEEVESLLTVEVKKLYNEKDPSYDRNEMIEEFHRMREHIYKEIDANRDGLISRKEFLDYSNKEEFNRDDGWKGIEEAPVYTEEELKRYEHERRQLQEHYAKYGAYNLPVQPGMQEYAYQPVYYQVADPNQIQHQQGQPGQQQHQQVYVVNAAPEHIQQPVQYQHVQLPPQNYQHQQQQHPAQITGGGQQQQQQYHPQQQQHLSSMPNQGHAQQQQQPMMAGQAPQQHQQAAHVAIQMNHPQQPQQMQHQMPSQQFQGQPQQPPHPNNQYGQPPQHQQQQQQQQQQQPHFNQMPAQQPHQPAQHPQPH